MDNLPIYKLTIMDDPTSEVGVDYVSLVERPAFERSFLMFKDQRQKFAITSEEQRILTGVLMMADTPVYRRDQRGEYYVVFDAETIKQIAQKFFKLGYQHNVNIEHQAGNRIEGLTMFESWLTDKARGVLPLKGFEDVPWGSWFGSFKVDNEEIWEEAKAGRFSGFSVEGIFNYLPAQDPAVMGSEMSQEEKIMEEIFQILESADLFLYDEAKVNRDNGGRFAPGEGGGGGSKASTGGAGRNPGGGGKDSGAGKDAAPKKPEVSQDDPGIKEIMSLAKDSAEELDKVGKDLASELGGTVTPVNLKSSESIARKVNDELGGDVSQVKDSVRSTVIVDRETFDRAKSVMENDPRFKPENGGRVKLQTPDKFLGYRGIVGNMRMPNGVIAEVQINTPAMIYAKEEKSLRYIDQKTYDNIARSTGQPAGVGHKLYEQMREIKGKIEKRTATRDDVKKLRSLKNDSVKYYANFLDI